MCQIEEDLGLVINLALGSNVYIEFNHHRTPVLKQA